MPTFKNTVRLVTARVSPMVELARWLLERNSVAYVEEPHAPLLHVLATRRAGGGNEVPVAIADGKVWDGARSFIYNLDATLPTEQKLFGSESQTVKFRTELVEKLLTLMLRQVRRHVYHALRGGSGNLHSGDKWSFCLRAA